MTRMILTPCFYPGNIFDATTPATQVVAGIARPGPSIEGGREGGSATPPPAAEAIAHGMMAGFFTLPAKVVIKGK
ncbi:hypothetical protein, partial [Stenotrophomonas daejeonensis]|uniref:hypothetical protein n=1 Tax=Stenotrophomonas daejeonensis TaxID=659018 RepID=UPI001B808C66